ncbi:hypothetical protein LIER_16605 [Lithospermum erythrorhizon]|uniref:Zinc knuckle CX2CX4HX4C domain-containing protein n=1 Tax=Lithospermum erythrorhizon TaxID=34254 RepID=A0AAV3QBE5_LITER
MAGEVMAVEWTSMSAISKQFVRVKVRFCLNNPLVLGTFIRTLEGNPLWIIFRYEKAFRVCYCGRIGHTNIQCRTTYNNTLANINDHHYLSKARNRNSAIYLDFINNHLYHSSDSNEDNNQPHNFGNNGNGGQENGEGDNGENNDNGNIDSGDSDDSGGGGDPHSGDGPYIGNGERRNPNSEANTEGNHREHNGYLGPNFRNINGRNAFARKSRYEPIPMPLVMIPFAGSREVIQFGNPYEQIPNAYLDPQEFRNLQDNDPFRDGISVMDAARWLETDSGSDWSDEQWEILFERQLEAAREESLNDNHLGAVLPIPSTDDAKLVRFFEDWSDFKVETSFVDGSASVNGLDLYDIDKDSGKSFTASSSSEKERRIAGFVICKSMSLIVISGIVSSERVEWVKSKAFKERECKENYWKCLQWKWDLGIAVINKSQWNDTYDPQISFGLNFLKDPVKPNEKKRKRPVLEIPIRKSLFDRPNKRQKTGERR